MTRYCNKCGYFEDETGFSCPICEEQLVIEDTTTYYCDGSGFNKKISRYCIMLPDDVEMMFETNEPITNNEAELRALDVASRIAHPNTQILTDSLWAVKMILGQWKLRAKNLEPLVHKSRERILEKNIHLAWIPRNENKAGIAIEKKQRSKKA